MAAVDCAAASSTVCVECGVPCTTLLRDSPSATATLRLTRCEACGHISDRYVEHDALVLVLDLLLCVTDPLASGSCSVPHAFMPCAHSEIRWFASRLRSHRAAAYRHLLHNNALVQQGSTTTLLHVGAVLAICDVHLKRTTQAALLDGRDGAIGAQQSLPHAALGLVWPFASSLLEFAAFAAIAARAAGGAVDLRRVAVALSYSSVGKALLVLSMIWEFPPVLFGAAVEAFTLSCNMVALRVVHEPRSRMTARRAATAVAAAAVARVLLAVVLLAASPS